jgi:hypothetical protein
MLEIFIALRSILMPLIILYNHLLYFVLVVCTKENLATLLSKGFHSQISVISSDWKSDSSISALVSENCFCGDVKKLQ